MAAFSYDKLRGEDREIRLVRFSDIFGRAALVYIWLGPSRHDSSDLFM